MPRNNTLCSPSSETTSSKNSTTCSTYILDSSSVSARCTHTKKRALAVDKARWTPLLDQGAPCTANLGRVVCRHMAEVEVGAPPALELALGMALGMPHVLQGCGLESRRTQPPRPPRSGNPTRGWHKWDRGEEERCSGGDTWWTTASEEKKSGAETAWGSTMALKRRTPSTNWSSVTSCSVSSATPNTMPAIAVG